MTTRTFFAEAVWLCHRRGRSIGKGERSRSVSDAEGRTVGSSLLRTIVQVTPSPILWPFVATGETEDAA
jgi:hypothetical protein